VSATVPVVGTLFEIAGRIATLKRFRTRLLLLVVAQSLIAAVPGAPAAVAAVGDCVPSASWGAPDRALASQVIQLVNDHRTAMGLARLEPDSRLTASAEWKSLHMAANNYLAHDDPAPPVARTVAQRLEACGLPALSAGWGENIAYGYPDAASVMDGWLNSPGHRANIENPNWTAIGVGVARSASGLLFWTQDFAATQPEPRPGSDGEGPTAPLGLSVTANGASLVVSWQPSGDNVGAAGYGVYIDGVLSGSVQGAGATISGLACGSTYTIGVDAVDAAGNRSTVTSTTATTGACASSTPPPAADTPAPTPSPPPAADRPAPIPAPPVGLNVASSGGSLVLSWQPASDDAVAGYGVYIDGVLAGSVRGAGATISGVACGSTYTIGVDAVDAAGNRSTVTSTTGTTGACASPIPPPAADSPAPTPTPPLGLSVAASGSLLILSWQPASDDIAIAGYGVFIDGILAGSVRGAGATISGLACGSTYTIGVDAFDAAGTRSTVTSAIATTTACTT
jgi:uncharacterized protein YkwD/chitodextrinase